MIPLSASIVVAPRLSQPFLPLNPLPSLFLNLSHLYSSFGSYFSNQPWKFPFTATASSQVSTANDELEKAKLEQVAKRLEKTTGYFKRLGNLGFWNQLMFE